MFHNWVIIAVRNFIKYRIFSLVNILGLAFGIAISILIFILVKQELNYDKYYKYHERIFRVNLRAEAFEYKYNSALTPFNLAVMMKQKIPEVEQTVRVLKGSHKKVSYNDIHYSANRFYYTDQSIFNIFSIPVIRGNRETLLTEQFTVVIAEKTARKYLIPTINDYFSSEIVTGSHDNYFEFYLQPLTDIHFSTNISGQFEAGRQKGYLYIFSLLAGIILFIACVNYMNLSTARLSTRTREVALRKVVGATRGQMILQFFSESIFFSLLATFTALVIIELILKPFNILSRF